MNMMSVLMVTASPQKGWKTLDEAPPSLLRLFALLIVPLSLLPAIMLFHAGTHYGDALIRGFSSKPWGSIAVAFFLTEVLTVLLMGWLIAVVAPSYGAHLSVHAAYRIAGIAPIPLWLSSLGLLVPSLLFNAVLAALAAALSCSLVYYGVQALCKMRDRISAAAVTHTVMSAGLLFWALLLAFVVSI
jgi:hypothetical protein